MIKGILSNQIGRKVVASTMFATAILGANASNLRDVNNSTLINQTEVVSHDVAVALRSRTLNLDLSERKIEKNKKLDRIYLNTFDSAKETRNAKSNLDAIYRVFGSNGAVIEIQRSLDDFYMDKVFESYLEHFSLLNDKRKVASKVVEDFNTWKNEEFYPEIFALELAMYEKTEYPTAEQCIEVVDEQIKNSNFFEKVDIDAYNEYSKRFASKQDKKDSQSAKSDLLAYKVHILDALAFNRYILKMNSLPEEGAFFYYFKYDFVSGENVIRP